jgi:hypothetical protein
VDNRIYVSIGRALAGLIALPLFTAAAAAQYYATPQVGGEVEVTDATGGEVSVVNGEPVGTRPDNCPGDAFYFNELATDKAQMVLTDCATGEGAFSVEFQAD